MKYELFDAAKTKKTHFIIVVHTCFPLLLSSSIDLLPPHWCWKATRPSFLYSAVRVRKYIFFLIRIFYVIFGEHFYFKNKIIFLDLTYSKKNTTCIKKILLLWEINIICKEIKFICLYNTIINFFISRQFLVWEKR